MNGNNEKQDNQKSRKTYLMVIIFILLAFNIFLLVKFFHDKKVISVTKEELVSTTDLKSELQKQVKDYELKVKEYKGKINEKDSTLVAFRTEIENQKNKILELIQNDKITLAKYKKAIEEIEKLKYYNEKYLGQINELMEENKELSNENIHLKKTVKQNKKTMDSLEDKTTHQANKLSLGAKLSAENIDITGLMTKDGGKQKETMRGSKMDGLKISYSIKDNILADKTIYEVFVKIINPKGETLFLEGYGSGKFTFQGEQSLYTMKTNMDFKNENDKVFSVVWLKGSNFEKGDYKIELYTEGQLIGQKKFTIK